MDGDWAGHVMWSSCVPPTSEMVFLGLSDGILKVNPSLVHTSQTGRTSEHKELRDPRTSSTLQGGPKDMEILVLGPSFILQ